MYCAKCGCKNEDSSRYCERCGEQLKSNAIASKPPEEKNYNPNFKCTNCGRIMYTKPEQVGVDNRNLPVYHMHGYCDYCKLKYDLDLQSEKQITCGCCGSTNINITVERVGESTSGRTELKKKGALTRAGNSIGRKGMEVATLGLWSLTPKRSKYKEVNTVSTSYTLRRVAVCNYCGNMWYL